MAVKNESALTPDEQIELYRLRKENEELRNAPRAAMMLGGGDPEVMPGKKESLTAIERKWREEFPGRHCVRCGLNDEGLMALFGNDEELTRSPTYKVEVSYATNPERGLELGLGPGMMLISCDLERLNYWRKFNGNRANAQNSTPPGGPGDLEGAQMALPPSPGRLSMDEKPQFDS